MLYEHVECRTKKICYLVRDDVGCLNTTLDVFRVRYNILIVSNHVTDSITIIINQSLQIFYCTQTLCLNISCVNPDHLGNVPRETDEGLKLNYVECCIDDAEVQSLFDKLQNEHGVLNPQVYDGIDNY